MTKIKVEKRIHTSNYGWTYTQIRCPICHEWQKLKYVKMHLASSKDKEHKNFVDNHSKIVEKKIIDVEFITE